MQRVENVQRDRERRGGVRGWVKDGEVRGELRDKDRERGIWRWTLRTVKGPPLVTQDVTGAR